MSTYAVREVPRGPIVGYASSIGLRRWYATCNECQAEVTADTRPAAMRALLTHVRRHWRAAR